MPSADTSPTPRGRPFREGLLALDPPRLLGSRCTDCGAAAFPARTFCPACRTGVVAPAELSTSGRVHSFTVVRQAPPGTEVPYTLAWVDLPADEVRLMAQVVGIAPEGVELDMPVDPELTGFGTAEDGTGLVGFCFRAVGQVAP
ncbi:Zn-ribbon domain-containing OB-fold protein [Pseudonocardia sp. EC080625-04]|uniref:Zn-ribbon domain-containing OB-fold protein n=1 Tax=Pseudonocardia sp. EC080625-04 TaxID=1096868 RepID=UPI000ACE3407|nr:Zn-ribbon domain-containing OB-fold protein [Pseudonocardia sp. EC080625-04]